MRNAIDYTLKSPNLGIVLENPGETPLKKGLYFENSQFYLYPKYVWDWTDQPPIVESKDIDHGISKVILPHLTNGDFPFSSSFSEKQVCAKGRFLFFRLDPLVTQNVRTGFE